jgi:hypothetical protein
VHACDLLVGLVVLGCLGFLQLLVAAEALAGDQLARWLGVVLLALNAIDQQFFVSAYPSLSSLIILLDVVSIYALVRYGIRENLARRATGSDRAAGGPVRQGS